MLERWAMVFTSFGVVGVEERVVGACGLQLRDPAPKGGLLVKVAYV